MFVSRLKLWPVWLALLTIAAPASAQKAPELGYAFPPAVRIGAETQVKLGGYDFTSDMQFFVHNEHVKLTTDGKPGPIIVPPPPYWFGEKGGTTAFLLPREISGAFSVDEHAQPGLTRWQVANANGGAGCAMIYLSDIPEIIEDRWREASQSIPPVEAGNALGISGRLSKIAEVDRYDLQFMQTGPVTVELFARRLGSNFHGVMEVRDGRGRLLVDRADTEGRDSQLTFFAEKGEAYQLRLYDVDYRGNQAFVYRLQIQSGPRVVATLPASLAPGETREVTFVGYGLNQDGASNAELQSHRQKVTVPKDARDSFDFLLKTSLGSAKVTFPVGDAPEQPINSTEPPVADDTIATITAAMAPSSSTAAPAMRFRFASEKGRRHRIEARSQTLGGSMDLAMRVEDAEQKVVASNDDANANVTDPTLQFTAREDGDYVCIVEDLSGRPLNAASVFQFRLETQPAAVAGSPPESSDFAVTAPQQIQLPIGGKASLKVTVLRQGFNGEIRLEVEGLPMGVTVPEKLVVPAKKPTATIAFTCGDDVAANAAPIRIRARAVAEEPKDGKAAETNGHEIVREVKAVASGNLAPRSDADTHESTFLLTTTMKPRYKVLLIDKNRQRAVHRGTTYPAPFVIEREEGYNAEVQLTMASKQSRHRQGIWGPVLTVPPKDTEAFYPCHLPEWLETDRTTRMIVLGVALDKDPQGNVRQVTQPSDARITMILEGALLRIAHSVSEPTVPKGGDLVVPFQLSRSKKLPGQVKVELVAPPEIAGFLNSEPVTVAADKSTGVLKIYSEPHERLQGSWDIALRATAMQDGRWPVVSTTKVTVEFE